MTHDEDEISLTADEEEGNSGGLEGGTGEAAPTNCQSESRKSQLGLCLCDNRMPCLIAVSSFFKNSVKVPSLHR